MTQPTPEQIAASLSNAQREYLRTGGMEGSTRGLVRRGLLGYRWGRDPSFGYTFTATANAIRTILTKDTQP